MFLLKLIAVLILGFFSLLNVNIVLSQSYHEYIMAILFSETVTETKYRSLMGKKYDKNLAIQSILGDKYK